MQSFFWTTFSIDVLKIVYLSPVFLSFLINPVDYFQIFTKLLTAMPYMYYTLLYAGKPSEANNEASKYYTSGTDEYAKYLVIGVNHYNSINGSNVSMEWHFTSVTIAQWALEKKIIIVGTIRLDRKGILKEIKSLGNREERSVLRVFDSDEKERSLAKGMLLP